MKGQILHYDDNAGLGQISGDDGVRYNFTRADLKRLVPIRSGTKVDFDFEGKDAKDIYVLSGALAGNYSSESEPELSFFGYFRRAMTSYYFNFSGRARRKEYWGFSVFPFVIFLALGIIIALSFVGRSGYEGPSPLGWVAMIVGAIFALAVIIPGIAVQVRRFHDIGQSGWWVLALFLVSFIPYVGLLTTIAYIVVGCIDTQANGNKFGPPPKPVAA